MSNDKRTVDNEQPNNISDFLENYAGEQWFWPYLWVRHGYASHSTHSPRAQSGYFWFLENPSAFGLFCVVSQTANKTLLSDFNRFAGLSIERHKMNGELPSKLINLDYAFADKTLRRIKILWYGFAIENGTQLSHRIRMCSKSGVHAKGQSKSMEIN